MPDFASLAADPVAPTTLGYHALLTQTTPESINQISNRLKTQSLRKLSRHKSPSRPTCPKEGRGVSPTGSLRLVRASVSITEPFPIRRWLQGVIRPTIAGPGVEYVDHVRKFRI